MILLTHAVVGAALGRLTPNPFLAFIFGFASHFVFDAIPHWEYRLASLVEDQSNPMKNDMVLNKRFVRDVFVTGLDFLSGILISFYVFQGEGGFLNPSPALFWGALGGVLPDALQFLYFKFRREPFAALEKLHLFIHPKKDLEDRPLIGITSQILIIILIIAVSKSIKSPLQ